MTALDWRGVLALGGVVLVLGVIVSRQGAKAAEAAAQAVNPVNPENMFYSGVNAVGGAITGDGDSFSLGSWIYDQLNAGTE